MNINDFCKNGASDLFYSHILPHLSITKNFVDMPPYLRLTKDPVNVIPLSVDLRNLARVNKLFAQLVGNSLAAFQNLGFARLKKDAQRDAIERKYIVETTQVFDPSIVKTILWIFDEFWSGERPKISKDAEMPNLETFIATNTCLSTLPLAPNLRKLKLVSEPYIHNFPQIHNPSHSMDNLTILSLKHCTELRLIPGLKSLQYLSIDNCPKLVKISGEFPELRFFKLHKNESVTDFPQGCKQLKVVDLLESSIYSIPSKLHQLTEVYIKRCPILHAILSGRNLRVLHAEHCFRLNTICHTMKHLTELCLIKTHVWKLPKYLDKVVKLVINACPIRDLSQRLNAAKYVDVSKCEYLADLPTEMNSVEELNAVSCQSLFKIPALPSLTSLNIAATPIRRLQSGVYTNLKRLAMQGTRIISPPKYFPKLEEVTLGGPRLGSVPSELPSLTHMSLRNSPRMKESLPFYPNLKQVYYDSRMAPIVLGEDEEEIESIEEVNSPGCTEKDSQGGIEYNKYTVYPFFPWKERQVVLLTLNMYVNSVSKEERADPSFNMKLEKIQSIVTSVIRQLVGASLIFYFDRNDDKKVKPNLGRKYLRGMNEELITYMLKKINQHKYGISDKLKIKVRENNDWMTYLNYEHGWSPEEDQQEA